MLIGIAPVCAGFRLEINPEDVPGMCCSVEDDIDGC